VAIPFAALIPSKPGRRHHGGRDPEAAGLNADASPSSSRAGEPGRADLAAAPNHVWAADHKGWVRLLDGVRCEPLTLSDSYSRYLIGLFAGDSTCGAAARPGFRARLRRVRPAETIRSEKAALRRRGRTGLTALSVWWISWVSATSASPLGGPSRTAVTNAFT